MLIDDASLQPRATEVSIVDVAPTLLDLVGATPPTTCGDGACTAEMAEPERTARRRTRLVSVLRVVLAVTFVVALLHWVGPAEVRERLAECPPRAALGSLVTALLGQWLGALRFARLAAAEGLPLSRMEALASTCRPSSTACFCPAARPRAGRAAAAPAGRAAAARVGADGHRR